MCGQRKVICYLELPLLIDGVDDSLEPHSVSEAELGVWQDASPTCVCGLVRGCVLLLGGVGGRGTRDVCLWPPVLGEGGGFRHPGSSDLLHQGIVVLACACLKEPENPSAATVFCA